MAVTETGTIVEEPAPEWLTVAEVAQYLGIDAKQVWRWAGRLDEADRTPLGEVSLREPSLYYFQHRAASRGRRGWFLGGVGWGSRVGGGGDIPREGEAGGQGFWWIFLIG